LSQWRTPYVLAVVAWTLSAVLALVVLGAALEASAAIATGVGTLTYLVFARVTA
jgi:hypothetical protein